MIAVSGSDAVYGFDLQRLQADLTPVWTVSFETSTAHVSSLAATDQALVTTGIFWNSIDFGQGATVSAGAADGFIVTFLP
jgi:hypothetical protein